MPTKHKIALVYDAIYPYSKGGAERRFYEIGLRLAGLGFEVHLYGMKYWDGPSTITRDGLILHGLCRKRPLYIKGGRRSISQAVIFGLATFKMVGQRFDVIDCAGFPYFSIFPSKLAALLRRKPLHVTWHEVWGREYWDSYLGRLGRAGAFVEQLASKMPNHIIAVSNDTAIKLRHELGYTGKLSIIANGVNVSEITSVTPVGETSDVVYFGRLMPFKNVNLLIEAINIVKINQPNIRCLIVGDGPERGNLVSLVEKLGIEDNVEFTGFIESITQVYGRVKASQVFVLPSAREGFGIAVVEANAAGLPVITVDLPGNAAKDLITDGYGEVVPATAPDLAAAITRQLATRQPAVAYAKIAASYDWDAAAIALGRLFAEPIPAPSSKVAI